MGLGVLPNTESSIEKLKVYKKMWDDLERKLEAEDKLPKGQGAIME